MRTSQKVFLVFILIAAVFIIGSLFDLHYFTLGANYLLVPILVLYYRYKARNWFIFLVLALFFFYLRDIFLIHGMSSFHPLALMSFLIGILILYGFAITGFPRSKVHFVEWLSLLIMYGFLGFLFYTMAELMAEVLTVFESRAYLFLFLLTLLLAITFTAYLLKSHYASLWLMLASASLLVSELSLFFKTYVVSDISVNVFYPLFHVITYYALVEHGLHRRRSSEVPYF